MRAGLTPFSASFKIGSEPVSIQSCCYEGFSLSPCVFANQSLELVLSPLINFTDHRPTQSVRETSSSPTGVGPHYGPVHPASGLHPRTLSDPSPTFLLPSSPSNEGIGGQGAEKGDQRRETQVSL